MTMIVTRFAPSPTGHLHVGGARTALFCWALARRHGGHFILRIEDTDRTRSSHASTGAILEDLAWLGIDWNEGPDTDDPRGIGPFFQSQRLDLYNRSIDHLIDRDLAYPAFESPEQLGDMRTAARARGQTFRYHRPADFDQDAAMDRLRAGEACVIRFCAPGEAIVVRDEVLGEVRFEPDQFDDFIIRKRDGFPTYHMAVVVDDELMGVTHVLRGQEHLMNTPRHVALQHALGFKTPVYGHLPLIFNPDGSKMSKRDKDKAARTACRERLKAGEAGFQPADQAGIDPEAFETWLGDKHQQLPADALQRLAGALEIDLPEIDVADFRASGYMPQVLCNYLALLGWNPGIKNDDATDLERFDLAFLAEHFNLDRIGKSSARFDRAKLLAFNADTIQNTMTDEQFAPLWRAWLDEFEPWVLDAFRDASDGFDEARFLLLASAARPRAKTFRDAIEPVRFALIDDDQVQYNPKAVKKVLLKNDGEGLALLERIRSVLEKIEPFEPGPIESAVKAFCEANDVAMGRVAQPLRVALTGRTTSPGLGQTLALVGRQSALARINRCLRCCAR